MPNLAESRVSAAALAGVLNLSPRRVHQLAAEGRFTRGQDGKFPLGASVAAYCKAVAAAPDEMFWRARLVELKAKLAAIELARQERDEADPLAIWPKVQRVVGGFSQRTWQTLPGIVPRLVDVSSPHQIYEVLTEWFRPLLVRLADETENEAPPPLAEALREMHEAEAAALAALRAADAEREAARHQRGVTP